VRFSPALKWLIAIFFPLTVAWKLTVRAHSDGHVEHDVITFLIREGFHPVVTEDTNSHRILAINRSCRMRVIISSNDGSDRDMIRSLVTTDEGVIFVHRGKVYQEQPILLTALTQLWTRPLSKMGLADGDESVLAVVAQRRCDASRLPWNEMLNRAGSGK